jgi:hypothetical protein
MFPVRIEACQALTCLNPDSQALRTRPGLDDDVGLWERLVGNLTSLDYIFKLEQRASKSTTIMKPSLTWAVVTAFLVGPRISVAALCCDLDFFHSSRGLHSGATAEVLEISSFQPPIFHMVIMQRVGTTDIAPSSRTRRPTT